jgi:hypothetical protein
MVGLAIFAILMGLLVVGPLVVRAWQERMQDRGLAIRAEIDAALRHELHGDSLLGVQVVPEAPWRTGRVEVSVPQGWDPVLASVSAPILARMPAGYELVVQHPGGAPLRAAA